MADERSIVRNYGSISASETGKSVTNRPCLHSVRVEQRRDLRLVSLELVKCSANRGLFVRNIFEFQHRQRDAVDESHHIRSPVEMAFLHRELVGGKKLVGFGICEINQPD